MEKKKILIVDDSHLVTSVVEKTLKDSYEVFVAHDSQACFDIVDKSKPDLILLDIMLPKVNGIQILNKLRSDPNFNDVGIIMLSGRVLFQDYQLAMDNGADYYLFKPIIPKNLREDVEQFFAGTLQTHHFELPDELISKEKDYELKGHDPDSYIKLWGTRGSIPVSGPEYVTYGGNTSCLEIKSGKDLIIIDAGSGIRQLGDEVLKSDIDTIHLFIGHTHWDHIQAFPFFTPAYISKYKIHIYAAKGFGRNIKELFTGMLNRDYFPVQLEDMQAEMTFHGLADFEPKKIGDVTIHYTYTNHPGVTYCFKIEKGDRSIGYATDNEFLMGYHGDPTKVEYNDTIMEPFTHTVDFFKGCNVLIHEAQYMPDEYKTKVGWGHSSVLTATVLIRLAEIDTWIATHHDPSHTDNFLREKLSFQREILRDCSIDCDLEFAYDGMKIFL